MCSTAALRMDFPVIAAAALAGKNLLTERGSAAETVISLVFIQTVGSGLVMLRADSYV
jgi:ribose/xylose/arabinose/galactoside ABC-type transport system permease subunit